MAKTFLQEEWNALIDRYPRGTKVRGVVLAQPRFGVWVSLDDLPDVLALLELIHFAAIEMEPGRRIAHPDDYPAVGSSVECRILAWSEMPKDVRLTQLSHLNWTHSESAGE